jgi:hypothetical protein
VPAGASETGTLMIVPFRPDGWAVWMVVNVASAIASTKPSPRVLSDERVSTMFWDVVSRSWIAALMARSLISEPPGGLVKLPEESCVPARSSVTWLVAPVTGL